MLVLCIVLAVTFLVTLMLFKWKDYPPGPFGLPILGYLPWIDSKMPYETFTKLIRKYGPVCSLSMGSVPTVLVSDPQVLKKIFAQDEFTGRAPLYLTHGVMKGYGIICAEGNLWKDQRKFVYRCLKNFGMINSQCPKRDELETRILRVVDECLLKLRDRSGEEGFDPTDTLHHGVGSFMNHLVFGKTFSEDNAVWKWLRHIQEEGVKHFGISGPLNFLPFLRFLPRFNNLMKLIVDGQKKTHDIYDQWIEDHHEKFGDNDNFLAAFKEKMIAQGSPGDNQFFTKPQIYYLLADIHGAGTDTALTVLRWFILFMAAYPEEQRKIHEEMSLVLGTRQPTLNDKLSLPRLEAAMCEVQRLRSITPVGIPHGTTQNTKIGKYAVPKGTMVVPVLWTIHTDPIYWPEPMKFKPDRFLQDGRVVTPEAFLPFQIGKRMCVGKELANMSGYLWCARILHNFTLSLPADEPADLEGLCGITLVPKVHRIIFSCRR